MTITEFIAKWRRVDLTERSASQQHFLDLCALVGQPPPAAADPTGTEFCFEKGAAKAGGGEGWADVWKRGHFAWEYKGRLANLTTAYQQLLQYKDALDPAKRSQLGAHYTSRDDIAHHRRSGRNGASGFRATVSASPRSPSSRCSTRSLARTPF